MTIIFIGVDIIYVVTYVFWTLPDSVKLLNTFTSALLMENTYKTQKYILSLLEIVDVTST